MEKNTLASKPVAKNRRRYTRVTVDCGAWFTADKTKQKSDSICNISRGGVCIQSNSTLNPGDMCNFELQDSGITYRFNARMAWKNDDYFGLEFVDIPPDSLFFLQTLVLYNASDPFDMVKEFQENFPRC